jgi:phenylacetate-CoA ligase
MGLASFAGEIFEVRRLLGEKGTGAMSNAIEKIQWDKCKRLLEHAYHRIPFYQRKFRNASITPDQIQTPADMIRLPKLTRSDLYELRSSLVPRIFPLLDTVVRGSGTTNRHTEILLDTNAVFKKHALLLKLLYRTPWRLGDPSLAFLHRSELYPGLRQKDPLFAFVKNRLVYPFLHRRKMVCYSKNDTHFDDEETKRYLKEASLYKPAMILGRPDFLYLLSRSASRLNLRAPSIKCVVNIGNLLVPFCAKIIADFFQCPLLNIYGSSEVSYISASRLEDPPTQTYTNTENHFIELSPIDSLKGKNMGSLLVTDLDNFRMPLIRYEVGDIVAQDPGSSAGCAPKPRLSVFGRMNSLVFSRSGTGITEYEIAEALFSTRKIFWFQIIRHQDNSCECQIIPEDPQDNEAAASLVDGIFREKFGVDRYKLKIVDRIRSKASGKFMFIETA